MVKVWAFLKFEGAGAPPVSKGRRHHILKGDQSMLVVLQRAVVLLAGLTLWAATARAALPMPNAEVVATGLQFPEGTIFVDGTLYFTDYATSDVLRLSAGKVEEVRHLNGCGANGLADLRSEILVACYDSGTIVGITAEGKTLETISQDDVGGDFVSPNDLAVDALGGVYFTGSGSNSAPGKIYYRAPAGQVKQVAGGLGYANGLVVSKDGTTLYLAESDRHRLLAFAIGPGGALSHKTVFVDLQKILADTRDPVITPDGLRIDENGHLFVGLYDGGGFAMLTSDGRLICRVALPGPHHANLAISLDGKYVFATAAGGASGGEILRVDNPLTD
jgi:gluconolactonase